MDQPSVTVDLLQQADYRFEARFDTPSVPVLVTDESPPLGQDAGPNPVRLLTVAVANCLSASLLFALRKFKNHPPPLHTHAVTNLVRNAEGRLRVASIRVDIHLDVAGREVAMLERALAQFEDFCVVTQSVRAAFPVEVRVIDGAGEVLNPAPPPTSAGT